MNGMEGVPTHIRIFSMNGGCFCAEKQVSCRTLQHPLRIISSPTCSAAERRGSRVDAARRPCSRRWSTSPVSNEGTVKAPPSVKPTMHAPLMLNIHPLTSRRMLTAISAREAICKGNLAVCTTSLASNTVGISSSGAFLFGISLRWQRWARSYHVTAEYVVAEADIEVKAMTPAVHVLLYTHLFSIRFERTYQLPTSLAPAQTGRITTCHI